MLEFDWVSRVLLNNIFSFYHGYIILNKGKMSSGEKKGLHNRIQTWMLTIFLCNLKYIVQFLCLTFSGDVEMDWCFPKSTIQWTYSNVLALYYCHLKIETKLIIIWFCFTINIVVNKSWEKRCNSFEILSICFNFQCTHPPVPLWCSSGWFAIRPLASLSDKYFL